MAAFYYKFLYLPVQPLSKSNRDVKRSEGSRKTYRHYPILSSLKLVTIMACRVKATSASLTRFDPKPKMPLAMWSALGKCAESHLVEDFIDNLLNRPCVRG